MTISAVNHIAGYYEEATVHVSSDMGSFPLCCVAVGTTISCLGLKLEGPQEGKLDVTPECKVYVLGSISCATYDYKKAVSMKHDGE